MSVDILILKKQQFRKFQKIDQSYAVGAIKVTPKSRSKLLMLQIYINIIKILCSTFSKHSRNLQNGSKLPCFMVLVNIQLFINYFLHRKKNPIIPMTYITGFPIPWLSIPSTEHKSHDIPGFPWPVDTLPGKDNNRIPANINKFWVGTVVWYSQCFFKKYQKPIIAFLSAPVPVHMCVTICKKLYTSFFVSYFKFSRYHFVK